MESKEVEKYIKEHQLVIECSRVVPSYTLERGSAYVDIEEFLKHSTEKDLIRMIEENETYIQDSVRIFDKIPCGLDGWNSIIFHALKKFECLERKENVQIHVSDIKEKYGTLRIYASVDATDSDNADKVFENVEQIIDKAEQESEFTCMYCGQLGTLREGNWLLTLCDECYEKSLIQKEKKWRKKR